ncbi:radical SAM family heme chaperone HemW [Salinicola rhizosphaerae]|uniref:Heme chaperone HemW n=1 Tax=Salinicola rhizosphaerae TaxID=1443141 RepID=A0ABQ3DV14_9GAMM|nr:radical SAM family heme chaperone HemW [Salinicola rhizosphaerae]GHB14112.1 YggW family oxidoreductase [Salinicola rhizosphaerae]
MRALPPLALYIHVPWCVRKCPYCDFNSHGVGRGAELPEVAYVEALLADLDADLEAVQGREIVSIFIGGGTPSLLSPAAYRRLFAGLRERLRFAAGIEITLEANPGTVEQQRFEGFREAGINRLSLGVQSFHAAQLEALGRIHSGDEAARAMTSARAAGFDNVNLDLMHGLPGQTLETALADIDQALALEPTHLSWYQLTLEPNTEFFSHPPTLPDEEHLWDIQDAGHERIEAAGLSRYEISAYARGGKRARHNLNYWQFGDYLGIGAGAHGKLTRRDGAGGLRLERRWKVRQPDAYLRRSRDPRGFVAGSREIDADTLPLEFLMNALRLVEGVDAGCWQNHTGRALSELSPRLAVARERGLLEASEARLQATPQGLLFLNDLLALFDTSR